MNPNQYLKVTYNRKGERISPKLPRGIKNFLIDIDGTICEDVPNEQPERMKTCNHFPDALKVINKWHKQGHVITFFTSRTEAHRKATEQWLKNRGFKYHSIIFCKPRGGNYHWIDNHPLRATRFNGKFTDFVKKQKWIEVFED